MPSCILFSLWSKNCLYNVQYAFLWEYMCESVPVAQSVWEEQGWLWPNKQRRKRKQTLETWPWTEPCWSWSWSYPAGNSGIVVTLGVTEWSLTPKQLFIKADRLGGDGWGSIYGREMRPWTVMLYSAKGQFTGKLLLLKMTVCLLHVPLILSGCMFYRSLTSN